MQLEAIRDEVFATPDRELPPVAEEQLERLRAFGIREER
jgi:hypothetical protein